MTQPVSMRITAIILAAGSSSRMGQSKQMLKIGGEYLLTRTVRAFLDAGVTSVVVVLGANEQAHRKLLEGLDVETVFNPSWNKGMGSSLKAGLKFLTSTENPPEAVVVSVCDQPRLSAANISNLVKMHQQTGKPIIASRYSAKPGVPALFDRSCFKKLESLGDEQGAKRILTENPGDVAEVEFAGGETDLDTMEDYEGYLKRPDRVRES